MGRKTKYCLNFGKGKHLNDGLSPSNMHCSKCYEEVKHRYEVTEKQGGAIVGLRAARMLAGGSFGYEYSQSEKERNLRAFFNYVMPEIPAEQANLLAKEIAYKSNAVELPTQNGGYKEVKMY